MRSILERAIEHLLNEDREKADALFHKFIVERARQVHESLRQGDEIVLTEGWNDEIVSEEYFSDSDLDGAQAGDETQTDDTTDTSDFGASDDTGEESPEGDDVSGVDDLGDGSEGEGEDDESVKGKLSHLEAELEKMTAEFKEVLANLDIDGLDVGDDDLEDTSDVGGEIADDSAVDSAVDSADDTGLDGLASDADVTEEDDHSFGNEDGEEEDEDHMWENFDLDGITEAVIAELEKINVDATTDGKEIGAGKKITQNTKSNFPNHGVKDRVGGSPVKSPFTKNDSFTRETPPPSKKLPQAKNAGPNATSFQSAVKPKGDAGAALNRDFAGGVKPSKSPIAGK